MAPKLWNENPDYKFTELAKKLEQLTTKLRQTKNATKRRELLREFRILLKAMDDGAEPANQKK